MSYLHIFFITNLSWYVAYSMHVRPLAVLQHIIGQVCQYMIGSGVLVGWMSVMGMFHLIKPSPIDLYIFHRTTLCTRVYYYKPDTSL
jgi:hypothetical protein